MSLEGFPEGVGPDLKWDTPVLPPGWQGISRLEVTTHPEGSVPRATLRVHLASTPSALGMWTVSISGEGDIPAHTVGTQLPDLSYIDVNFDALARGTFYATLELVDPNPDLPLHPFFATFAFSLNIECLAGDCRAYETGLQAAGEDTAPAVDLLTKDFEGFLQLLAERVRVRNPNWTDLAPASFERVLIDLLAHQGDMLSYYQDRVANEAFLDTATQRYSLRQHGLLLGYELGEAIAASTLLAISPGGTGSITIPEGLAVRLPRRPDEAPVVFSVTTDTVVTPGLNPTDLAPAQWSGASSARIPAGSTSMLLYGHPAALTAGREIAIELPGVGTELRTITEVETFNEVGWTLDPTTQFIPTTPVAVTRIHWEEGLSFDLPIWREADPGRGREAGPPFSICGNLVPARYGQWKRATLRNTPLFPDSPTEPNITLAPQNATIVKTPTGSWQLRALRLLEGPVLLDQTDDGRAEPAVEVELDGERWYRVDHLHRSLPFDRHFTAEADEDGRLWITFGDGMRGSAIPLNVANESVESARLAATQLRFRYRVGQPLAGNIASGRLTEFGDAASMPPGSTVTNVTPGSGGQLPETLDAARLAIPASLHRFEIERAVTLADYARIAELADPRVERATARRLDAPFSTVLILVDQRDAPELSEEVRSSVLRGLERARMVGREVLVRSAEAVALDVEIAVCVKQDFGKHDVKRAVLSALRPGTSQNPGFFHPNRLSFGQDIELSDVIAEVQGVPGVLAAKALVFKRIRSTAALVEQRIALGATEVARLDADPLDPDNGRLVVLVPGLDEIDGEFVLSATPEAIGVNP